MSALRASEAVDRLRRAGCLVAVELGPMKRYAYTPAHERRGLQVCERLVLADGQLTLTRARLAERAPGRALMREASSADLIAGLDEERARWAKAGLAEADNEVELLQALSSRDPVQELALCEAEEDDELRARALVYTDWLLAQGDPRGQLGALAFAANASEQAIERFIHEHASHLLGSLEFEPSVLHWLGPLILSAELAPPAKHGGPKIIGGMVSTSPQTLVRARELEQLELLLGLPASSSMRRLVLERDFNRHPAVSNRLAAAPCARSLRELSLIEPIGLCVAGSFERLERLTVRAASGTTRLELSLPCLRELALGFLHSRSSLEESLAGLDAPRLEQLTLEIESHDSWRTAHGTFVEQLGALLGLPSFAGLRVLTLRVHGASFRGFARALARCPAQGTLERIDLRGTTLDAESRAALVAEPGLPILL